MNEDENERPAGRPVVRSRIWREEQEPDDPYTARAAYCRGFDVYGEMLGQARWAEMLYLLFHEEPPQPWEVRLLDDLALALANPGPREASVHAAMCSGVCGSPAASALMAALAVGAGQAGGAREVWLAMSGWQQCGIDLDAWHKWLKMPPHSEGSIWPKPEHPPGFDPRARHTATPVRQTLACLARHPQATRLTWLQAQLEVVERASGLPLAMSGVAAAALVDLGFSPDQGEMMFLLLRLPGAAAHALEQRPLGYKKFPFGAVELVDTEQEAGHE